MSICYKTLFETNVFHEYYLTNPDGTNIFDLNDPNDRITFLRQRFAEGKPSINEELDYVVPTTAQRMFRDHRLRLLRTFGGFKVAMEVTPEVLGDGTTTYRPKVALEDGEAIPILLIKKSSHVDAFTNGRMRRETNAAYYFSGEAYAGAKTFPFLSNPIPPVDPAYTYEQGELADHGANTIKAFYHDSTNGIRWLPLKNSAYANETDRLLVPLGFYYSFDPVAKVTQADLVLRNSVGDVVREYSFNQAEPIQKAFISVRPEDVLSVPDAAPGPQLLHTLEVTGSNGYSRTVWLVFYSGPERIDNILGLVHIKVRNTNAGYDLLDNGLLLTRRRPDGVFDPVHRIFEVRLRSRIAFWRYINDKKKDFQNNLHQFQLELEHGKLVSKEPRALTHTPLYFKKSDNSPYYLPNPAGEILRSEGNRLFVDIYVSESKGLFPSGP